MSQYYDLGDKTLWNPSNAASRLFLSQLTLFEGEIGLLSGIGPMDSDEAQISLTGFEAFVSALLTWHARTSHAVIHALSEGFIATCLVLADRAGATLRWPEPTTGGARLREMATALASSMPS